MESNLLERHRRFEALHKIGIFVMPNPWDVGSARMMAALGARALATSSAAHAFVLGRPDMGNVTREEALMHASTIVAATPLPVNGDLENGYGDSPEDVAETVKGAAEAGLSGCSIEDTTMRKDETSYAFELALDRVRAGVEASRSLGHPFVFTARADGVMLGSYDMTEALRRVRAFAHAGADVVYVPIPPGMEELASVCTSVSCPVNALAAGPYTAYSVADFEKIGVRRVSLGSSIARAVHRTIHDAVSGMMQDGTFSYVAPGRTIAGDEVDLLLKNGGTENPPEETPA